MEGTGVGKPNRSRCGAGLPGRYELRPLREMLGCGDRSLVRRGESDEMEDVSLDVLFYILADILALWTRKHWSEGTWSHEEHVVKWMLFGGLITFMVFMLLVAFL